MEKRTVKDFVRDMYRRGRSKEEIRAVASSTRWANQKDEVERWIRKGEQIRKKKGKKSKRLKIKLKKVPSN